MGLTAPKRGAALRARKGAYLAAALCLLALGCRPEVTRTIVVAPVDADQATVLVAEAESELRARRPSTPLDDPQTAEDVRAILQMDRIDLFANAVARADVLGGFEALVLAAQIELAWGEAQFVVAAILRRAAGQLEEKLRHTSSQRGLGAERRRLEAEERRARDTIVRSRRLADALQQTAAQHVQSGVERTQALRIDDPNGFLALRLAADYHRVQGDWDEFAGCLERLEAIRPDSTGLKFQRGAAAMRRDDLAEARRHLAAALTDDPEFTRAQVFLLGAQREASGIRRQWDRLRTISPDHQLVVWAGPLIERILLAE